MKLFQAMVVLVGVLFSGIVSAQPQKEDQTVFFFANFQSNQPVAANIQCVNPGHPDGFKFTVINSKMVEQPEYQLYFGVNGEKGKFPEVWKPVTDFGKKGQSLSAQEFMVLWVNNADLFIDRNNRDHGMRFGIGRNAEEAKQYSLNMKARPILVEFKRALISHSCVKR